MVFGTLGWNFTEGKVQAWISVLSLLIFGLYEIMRTDSAQTAINYIEAEVKSKLIEKGVLPNDKGGACLTVLVLILAFVVGCALVIPTSALAASSLCVEPLIVDGTYTLEVDGGTPIPDLPFVVETDQDGVWHCIYDVGTLGGGEHTFRVMAVDISGWEGVWSDPFVAVRPGASQRWKIKKK